MKILYLDCFSGISGDMLLGALLDLGVDGGWLVGEIAKLGLSGYEIKYQKATKHSITGTDVEVAVYGFARDHCHGNDSDHDHEHGHENGHDHGHGHDNGHDHGHGHDNGHDHGHGNDSDHDHEHGHGHDNAHANNDKHEHMHRTYGDIVKIIDASGLGGRVKTLAKQVFAHIADAEGKVHNLPRGEVRFHEVGALDSIVDIVGACACIDKLGVGAVYSSELRDGKGFVETMHGRLPVPVPAVLEMLAGSGIPLVQEDVPFELVTPTGAGLVKTLAVSYGKMPAMRVEGAGYGFGKRETGRLNALRAVLGDLSPGSPSVLNPGSPGEQNPGSPGEQNPGSPGEQNLGSPGGLNPAAPGADSIASLEANIDDMTPEALGYAMGRLFAGGALDVFFTPIYMKKNRPATLLTVLSRLEDSAALTDAIFLETTTLGVRETRLARQVMGRRVAAADFGADGTVRCKIAERKGVRRVSPEYEDCRAYAERTGRPLDEAYRLALGKIEAETGGAK